MKTIKINTFTKAFIFAIFAVTIIFSMNSCNRKIAFQTSTVIPAARGTVAVKKDNNNNFNINIQLAYFAEPTRLQPAHNAYVVWLLTNSDNMTHNIGQIKTSGNLKASFETVSSLKPNKIFITAEDDAGVQSPTTQIVLTTDNLY